MLSILLEDIVDYFTQSKTLTPKNKNKIFPKFLSPSITTTYG